MTKGERCESDRGETKGRREGFSEVRKGAGIGYSRSMSVEGSNGGTWNSEGRNSEEQINGDKGESSLRVLKVLETTALTRNKAQLFPTTRRPEKRMIPTEDAVPQAVVDEWFTSTMLRVGIELSADEQQSARRLLYT